MPPCSGIRGTDAKATADQVKWALLCAGVWRQRARWGWSPFLTRKAIPCDPSASCPVGETEFSPPSFRVLRSPPAHTPHSCSWGGVGWKRAEKRPNSATKRANLRPPGYILANCKIFDRDQAARLRGNRSWLGPNPLTGLPHPPLCVLPTQGRCGRCCGGVQPCASSGVAHTRLLCTLSNVERTRSDGNKKRSRLATCGAQWCKVKTKQKRRPN